MISLKNIEQPYLTKAKEKLYLRNINLDIASGEIFGIIGRSGSGKSALLKCINLIERPMTGMVCIDKMNYTIMVKTELREARRNIGMVPQQVQLISNKTVYSNIILPLEFQNFSKDETSALANQIMALTGLEDKAGLFPRQLSLAQQQRLSIARAMVTKPKVLLCDEITSGLDNKNTQAILQTLKEINYVMKTTIIMITHDLEVIKSLCDRVGVMHHGEIVEQTNAFDLFVAPKSEIAKDFIRSSTKLEMPWVYRRKLKLHPSDKCHPVIRIVFNDLLSPELIIGKAIDKYRVKVSILQAHQEVIQNKQVKILIAEVEGSAENTQLTQQFLLSNGLHVEAIGYVNDHY